MQTRVEAGSPRAMGLCGEQWSARGDLCDILDEDPYDLDFEPPLFDDDASTPSNPSPHIPSVIGDDLPAFSAGD